MVEPIPTQRRTLASTLDDTCDKLDTCPTPPPGAVHNALSGGSVIITGMERWRCNAAGEIIEYTEWKMPTDRVTGKSPYKRVWWKE